MLKEEIKALREDLAKKETMNETVKSALTKKDKANKALESETTELRRRHAGEVAEE